MCWFWLECYPWSYWGPKSKCDKTQSFRHFWSSQQRHADDYVFFDDLQGTSMISKYLAITNSCTISQLLMAIVACILNVKLVSDTHLFDMKAELFVDLMPLQWWHPRTESPVNLSTASWIASTRVKFMITWHFWHWLTIFSSGLPKFIQMCIHAVCRKFLADIRDMWLNFYMLAVWFMGV